MSDPLLYCYCTILIKGSGTPFSYISAEGTLPLGTRVEVPFGSENHIKKGTVLSCGEFTAEDAPYPVPKTKKITRILTEEEFALEEPEKEWAHWKADCEDELEEVAHYMEFHDYNAMFRWASDHHNCVENYLVMRRVIECYKQCMEQNMPDAALNLGTLYYNGVVVKQDFKKAAKFYKIAADAGSLQAICNLGYCFYYGRHQEVDYKKAFEYFQLGALLFDDVNCLYKLGDMYLNGYSVKKNASYAWKLYLRAWEQLAGHDKEPGDCRCMPDVQFRLGKCRLRGIGVAKDAEQALLLLVGALCGFYQRRKTDPFVTGMIDGTKELIAEAESMLDGEQVQSLRSHLP